MDDLPMVFHHYSTVSFQIQRAAPENLPAAVLPAAYPFLFPKKDVIISKNEEGDGTMTLDDIRLRRLAGQHLLTPSDTGTVAGPVSFPCPARAFHPVPGSPNRNAHKDLDEPGYHAPDPRG